MQFAHPSFGWAVLGMTLVPLATVDVCLAQPADVTLVGTGVGCTELDLPCAGTAFTVGVNDAIWRRNLSLAAGTYTYRAAIDGGAAFYGEFGILDGTPRSLELASASSVRFYYEPDLHWVTSARDSQIATAAGDFQSELGCPGDWQPDCLRSWLTDVDGDGVYTFTTTALPAGTYSWKVAIDEGWNTSYGDGGAPGGTNLSFVVPVDGASMAFRWDGATHVPSVEVVMTDVDAGLPPDAGPDANVDVDASLDAAVVDDAAAGDSDVTDAGADSGTAVDPGSAPANSSGCGSCAAATDEGIPGGLAWAIGMFALLARGRSRRAGSR